MGRRSERRQDHEIKEIIDLEHEIIDLEEEILHRPPNHRVTPTHIRFTEITMNPTQAGQTQVFTGTLQPAATGTTPAAAFPAGTTFTATANDDALNSGAITIDPTGTVLTVVYPTGWVENSALPLAITVESSTFVPYPATSPSQISAVVTPSAPPAAVVPTPTSISFVQSE